MASKYWIKLYHEILDDPKMGRLPDRLWRRVIELFLIAGDYDQEGALPNVGDMAWRLRATDEELLSDLDELEQFGIVSLNGAIHVVTNFAKRQAAASDAERMRRYRDRNRFDGGEVTEGVTNCNTDTDTEEDTDIEEDTAPPSGFTELLDALLLAWSELFPKKPQPRRNTKSLQSKIRARLKENEFREHWMEALERASKSSFLHSGSWFTLQWFVGNDEHWQRCYDGNYDGKAGDSGPIQAFAAR